MPKIGGKPIVSKVTKTLEKKTSSSTTKRNFTVVIGSKEHGLYVSSSPSSAARKAVSKLCATNKKRKVRFHIREITQGSKKKTYGPYLGYIEKLAKPIELKGRVIRYKPVVKLSKKTGLKKKVMTGGESRLYIGEDWLPYFELITDDVNPNRIKLFNIWILLLYKFTINNNECCISTFTRSTGMKNKTDYKHPFMFSDCVTQELLEKFLSDEELKETIRKQLITLKISNLLINLNIPHMNLSSRKIIYKCSEFLRFGEISNDVNITNTNYTNTNYTNAKLNELFPNKVLIFSQDDSDYINERLKSIYKFEDTNRISRLLRIKYSIDNIIFDLKNLKNINVYNSNNVRKLSDFYQDIYLEEVSKIIIYLIQNIDKFESFISILKYIIEKRKIIEILKLNYNWEKFGKIRLQNRKTNDDVKFISR
jgi:hypothetical protein